MSKRIPHVLGHVGIAAAYLHRVERGGKSEREFMQMMLKLTVVGKAEPSNDAHYRGGIGAQAFGHGAHAEENVFARVLEYGANNFLALGAEVVDAFRKIYRRCLRMGGLFFHAARELRKMIFMSTPRPGI